LLMPRRVVLVSACLLGLNTKYDGGNNYRERVARLLEREDLVVIPFCPEQLGGLPTPREPADLTADGSEVLGGKGRVITWGGRDVTHSFVRGAEESLKLARMLGARAAVLKARSPSCGVGGVYRAGDRRLMPWNGVTAAILIREGIRVMSDEEFSEDALERALGL